jgi:hypothetical protein
MAKARSDNVIITGAITGGIRTATMSKALPSTPDDIAAQSATRNRSPGYRPSPRNSECDRNAG